VRDALNALAAALRPGSEAPPAPIALTAGSDSAARQTFTRNERLVARAGAGAGPAVTAKARLLSRLGQPLVDLPVTVNAGTCEAALALGSLGLGDYVLVMTIQSGGAVDERYVAFRVAR
jgi:hypothetical protein